MKYNGVSELPWHKPPEKNKKKLAITFDKPQRVNYYQIQEDITEGEHIRAYRIEALINGKWTTVAKGSSVGHKRIEAFPEVEAQAFRLIVEQCVSTPLIRNFSIYHVTAQSDRQ